MFLKNSIKCLYRSPIKTFLLIFLLGLAAFIWELGMSVRMDIRQFLKDCDGLYVTLGKLDYIGSDYPNEYTKDAAVQGAVLELQKDKIFEDASVQVVEKNEKYFGNIQGYNRGDVNAPAKNETVLLITGAFFEEESFGLYQARVKECLFADKDLTGSTIMLETGGIELDRNKNYILYGVRYEDKSMIPYVYLTENKEISIEEVPDNTEIPKGYQLLAQRLQTKHDGVAIYPTDNLESLFPFHSKQLYIQEGRSFNQEDYRKKTCIINGIMAEQLQVTVGDMIQLSWMEQKEYEFWDSYWPETGFSKSEEFEIVGITNKMASMGYQIYVTKGNSFYSEESTIFGYEIAHCILNNRTGANFAISLNEKLGPNYRFTIYDHGYEETVGMFVTMEFVASMVVLASSIFCFISLLLVTYICIFNRKQEVRVLTGLGAKRSQIIRYYFYAAMLPGGLGIGIGSILAMVCQGRVIEWIKSIQGQKDYIDLRFSDFNRSMQRKNIAFDATVDLKQFLIMMGILFIVCIVMVLIFCLLVNASKKKRKQKRILQKIRLSGKMYGVAGVAYKHIFRKKFQSIGILLFGCVVVVFTGVLLNSVELTKNKIADLETNQVIKGHLVDYQGYLNSRLLLDVSNLEQLASISNINKVAGSCSENYQFLGVSEKKDGVELTYTSLPIPTTRSQDKAQGLRFLNGASVVFTNDLYATSEFVYKKDIKMEFAEGYSINTLEEAYQGELRGMISYNMADEESIHLGDTIVIAVNRAGLKGFYREYKIKVIGFFERTQYKNNIYCPLSAIMDITFLHDKSLSEQRFAFAKFKEQNYSLSQISFEIQGIGELSEVKDSLEKLGFAQIVTANGDRKFVMLEDGIYLHQYENLLQQKEYISLFTSIMIILCMIANIALSGLFIRNSRWTIGIMRGLGASPGQIFKIKFIEIGWIYVLGAILGTFLLAMKGIVLESSKITLILLMIFFFIGGFMFTFWQLSRQNLRKMLKEEQEK